MTQGSEDRRGPGREDGGVGDMRHNAKVSGGGTPSAALPGYAGDNNGE